MRRSSNNYSTYYKAGSNNAWCQRCGKKVKSDQLRVEWDSLKVCNACYDERHPQDMVRGIVDMQAAQFVSPEFTDKFTLPADVIGVTTDVFAAGPEELFDDTNSLKVQLISGALPTGSELDILNGANLVAVEGPDGWEVLQYTIASLTAPSTYSLTHLLRARYGTELAMGTLSAGSPFVYLGQASAANSIFMRNYLQVGDKLFSPVNIQAYEDSGDVVIGWTRRSRIPSIELDDWGDSFAAPLDSQDERWAVEVLSPGGEVVRTLEALGGPQVTYSAAAHLADWGARQAVLTVKVYQVDVAQGRGTPRQATIALEYGTAFDTLYGSRHDVLTDHVGNILI